MITLPLFRSLGILMGALILSSSVILLNAQEPPRPRLILIQGPRPEIRRAILLNPRPEPQGYPSGWLYPSKSSAAQSPSQTTTKIYSVYGDGSSKIKPTPSRSESQATVTRQPEIRKKASSHPAKKPAPSPMVLEIKPVKAPAAEWISPGLVKSPYAPHVALDVQGLSSGTLVKDPVSGKLFRVPRGAPR